MEEANNNVVTVQLVFGPTTLSTIWWIRTYIIAVTVIFLYDTLVDIYRNCKPDKDEVSDELVEKLNP